MDSRTKLAAEGADLALNRAADAAESGCLRLQPPLHANPAPAAGAAPAGLGGGEARSVLGCPPLSRGLRDEGHEGEDNPTPPPGRPGGLPPGEEGGTRNGPTARDAAGRPRCARGGRRRGAAAPHRRKVLRGKPSRGRHEQPEEGAGRAPGTRRREQPEEGAGRSHIPPPPARGGRAGVGGHARSIVCIFFRSGVTFCLTSLGGAARPSGRCPSRSPFMFRSSHPQRIRGALGSAATRGLANARCGPLSRPKIAVVWMKA
jgi:hypothetical protein